MKIYIDFDDVICETAKNFTKLAKELFEIEVPYNQIQFFNLQKTFGLSDEQYTELMTAGHEPKNLLDYEETKDASVTINKWLNSGHDVKIITGRPYDSYEPSRKWLDEHGLKSVPLFCVDKYGRESFNQNSTYSLTLKDFYNMNFDFVVEDSPVSFEHILNFKNCITAVFDRPWNRTTEFTNEKFIRCSGWKEIDKLFEDYSKNFSKTT